MKTLRISDDVHRKLTATVGTLMAQTGKMQTYQDAIEAMLTRSVILPRELLAEIEKFIEETFLVDAISFLELLSLERLASTSFLIGLSSSPQSFSL
jgi:hypothetical protein